MCVCARASPCWGARSLQLGLKPSPRQSVEWSLKSRSSPCPPTHAPTGAGAAQDAERQDHAPRAAQDCIGRGGGAGGHLNTGGPLGRAAAAGHARMRLGALHCAALRCVRAVTGQQPPQLFLYAVSLAAGAGHVRLRREALRCAALCESSDWAAAVLVCCQLQGWTNAAEAGGAALKSARRSCCWVAAFEHL